MLTPDWSGGYSRRDARMSFISEVLRVDLVLFTGLLVLIACGMAVLYSAGGGENSLLVKQTVRLGVGMVIMLVMAQIPAEDLRLWSPWFYVLGVVLLLFVMFGGDTGKGAQRWLGVGGVRFQPSEMMKLVVPMTVAWFFADKHLPPGRIAVLISLLITMIPAGLVVVQPDLGTALLIMSAGVFAIFFAGISWRLIASGLFTAVACTPLLWHFMHDYQKQRVLTMLDPHSDPLGSGYHIIQSEIAIGSGGVYGKGWLNGTQSQLEFIPEQDTDFIFAVFGEEFGFLGVALLLMIYTFIVFRGLVIAIRAQDAYSRLLAGSLSLSFFVYFFVNIGMVSGLLPVVGVPLPLISRGGTSMVTLMAAFGMLMSISTHRRLLRH